MVGKKGMHKAERIEITCECLKKVRGISKEQVEANLKQHMASKSHKNRMKKLTLTEKA